MNLGRNMRQTAVIMLLALILAMLVVSGCSIRLGWVASEAEGSATARFTLFTGEKTKVVKAGMGDTIRVDYDSKITGGSLSMALVAPDGAAIELETNTKGSRRFTLDQEGQYKVVIKGHNARGEYAISWVKE